MCRCIFPLVVLCLYFHFIVLFPLKKEQTPCFFSSPNDEKRKLLQSQLWRCDKSPSAAFWRATANHTAPGRDPVFLPFQSFFVRPSVPLVRLVWAVISQFGSEWPSVAEPQKDSPPISRPPLSQRRALIGPFNQRLFICLPWCDVTAAVGRRFLCSTEATSGLFRPAFEFECWIPLSKSTLSLLSGSSLLLPACVSPRPKVVPQSVNNSTFFFFLSRWWREHWHQEWKQTRRKQEVF